MKPSRILWIVFVVQALMFTGVGVVALDLYAHKRNDPLAGMNIRGYRDVVAHQKQTREIRLAVIGGTRAFGLGMPASWTIATVLRQQVMLVTDRPGGEVRPVVSLTLARPGALPDSYSSTIEYFAYLRPDYIVIYDDLGVGGAPLPEETSGLFAHAGYWPALPLALREKGMLWRFGSVRAGYVRGTTAGSAPPAWISRVSGAVLEAAGTGLSRVDRAMARPAVPHRGDNPERYVTDMMNAVSAALGQARGVVVAVSPAESRLQSANLGALLPRMNAMLAATPRLRFLNLSSEAVLTDPLQRLDDWNIGGDAIAAAAKAITPSILELIATRESGTRFSR